jgi:hypothetical protein
MKNQLSRRTLFAGAATLGATVVAVKLLPGAQPSAPPGARPPPENGGGYRLTEHVKRYYQSART